MEKHWRTALSNYKEWNNDLAGELWEYANFLEGKNQFSCDIIKGFIIKYERFPWKPMNVQFWGWGTCFNCDCWNSKLSFKIRRHHIPSDIFDIVSRNNKQNRAMPGIYDKYTSFESLSVAYFSLIDGFNEAVHMHWNTISNIINGISKNKYKVIIEEIE